MPAQDDFRALVDDSASSYSQIHAFLSGLSVAERCDAIYGVGGVKRQARLFELAKEAAPLTLDQLIPPDRAPLDPVICYGKNSLPMFTSFQKRFCRAAADDPRDVLYGYNHHVFGWATGPGYYLAKNVDHELGGVAVDYYQVPTQKPASWPAIKDNSILRSRAVYYQMIDYLRPLAEGIYIGRAVIREKITNNYFLLSREF